MGKQEEFWEIKGQMWFRTAGKDEAKLVPVYFLWETLSCLIRNVNTDTSFYSAIYLLDFAPLSS